MKKIVYIFLINLLVFTSCGKDVLEKQPLDIITEKDVWNDPALIDAYLADVYYHMSILTNDARGLGWEDGEGGGGAFTMVGVCDEARTNFWGGGDKFGNLKYNSSLEWWESAYKVIRSLNIFIQKVPSSTLAPAMQKKRIAEARFLRAFNYFAMVKRYGGVPIITEPQNVNDPEDVLYPKRAKEQEVYDFVLAEMDAIMDDLDKTGYNGRPTKYAALALKCRAALYAGSIAQFGIVQIDGILGIPSSEAASYYQKAYDVAKMIMESNNYSLYNKYTDKVKNFRNLFIEKDNSEVIWAKKHDFTNLNTGGNGWVWDFFQGPVPNAWGSGSVNNVYLEMAEAFEYTDGSSGKLDRAVIQQGLWTPEQLWANKEPRFFASIYTQGTVWKGAPLDVHYGILLPDGTIETIGSYNGVLAKGKNIVDPYAAISILKYCDESHDTFIAASEFPNSGTDWILFRYGEVLLNYAEAAFELGKMDDALNAINQIRSRAGVATLASIDRAKIHQERRVELAFEGHRYWDARRWRTAVEDFTGKWSGLQYIQDVATGKFKLNVVENVDGSNGAVFFPENYYFRIGLGRVANNKNLVENPGYD